MNGRNRRTALCKPVSFRLSLKSFDCCLASLRTVVGNLLSFAVHLHKIKYVPVQSLKLKNSGAVFLGGLVEGAPRKTIANFGHITVPRHIGYKSLL